MRNVYFAAAVVALVCSPFSGMLVGRLSYHALIWFSRWLGFAPAADPGLQVEAMGGVMFGLLGFAFVFLGAALFFHRALASPSVTEQEK